MLQGWDAAGLGCCGVGMLQGWDAAWLGCCGVGMLPHEGGSMEPFGLPSIGAAQGTWPRMSSQVLPAGMWHWEQQDARGKVVHGEKAERGPGALGLWEVAFRIQAEQTVQRAAGTRHRGVAQT